mgnify:CR=1 FL=1
MDPEEFSDDDEVEFMEEISAEDAAVRVEAVISVNEPTINPDLLVNALRQNAQDIAPDFAKFKRLEIYDENMEIFR